MMDARNPPLRGITETAIHNTLQECSDRQKEHLNWGGLSLKTYTIHCILFLGYSPQP